jgi:hypothetical protein
MDAKLGRMEFAYNVQLITILTKRVFVVALNPNAELSMSK